MTIDADEVADDAMALIDYMEARGLSPGEVAFLGAYVAGIGIGQESGQDEIARRRMLNRVQSLAEKGAGVSDRARSDVLTGAGRWRT